MFIVGALSGERAMQWRPEPSEPAPRLRVLLPGQGSSVRAKAGAATFVPSIDRPGRGNKPRYSGSNSARPNERAADDGLVLPGDPTPTQLAWHSLTGNPGVFPADYDRVERLGLFQDPTPVFTAAIELANWRREVAALPPCPELVGVLANRPNTLAPPAPSAAVGGKSAHDSVAAAAAAGVPDEALTGWANAVLDSITARARVIAWLQAEQYTDLAILSQNYPGLAEMLPTEVGFALRTSDAVAGNAISTARAMSSRLPDTLEALRSGLIDSGHAMALVAATATTTPEVTSKVEADLLPVACAPGSTITAEQLRRRAARRVIKHDPDGAADRHRVARKERAMTRWMEDDGMAGLKVLAPVEQIAAMWEAATALADAAKQPGDERGLGNRRVDALADLCNSVLDGRAWFTPPAGVGSSRAGSATEAERRGGGPVDPDATGPAAAGRKPSTTDAAPQGRADKSGPMSDTPPIPLPDPRAPRPELDGTSEAGSVDRSAAAFRSAVDSPCPATDSGRSLPKPIVLPQRHGHRPHIQVLVPYTVLLGGSDPCELAGHGPITAEQARMIIADGVLQRILYDPVSGTVLDYGRTRYEPPDSLRRFVVARDLTCRAPGCRQPADRCQIDHVNPFRPGAPIGGATSHVNLCALCHHHHRAKDGCGFTITRDADGTIHWTTPLGRQYVQPPNQVVEPDPESVSTPSNFTDLDDGFPAEFTSLIEKTTSDRGSAPEGRNNAENIAEAGVNSDEEGEDVDDAPPF